MKAVLIFLGSILLMGSLQTTNADLAVQQPKVICFKDNCECFYNGQYKYEYDKEWDGYTCGCNSDHKYWVAKPRP
jgi:hypothetical protein